MKSFDEIFIDKTKYGVKVQTSEYGEVGEHIIIDQGQEQVAGYTDREEGVFEEVPVIIFGDHTRAIKYVDVPFFLGADGVKVLRSKDENANYKYLYYALKNAKIPNTGYNRHFKWLKEVHINYPDSEKQAEIVEILDKVSSVIKKREDELSVLENLIKARFVEMFGDPVVHLYKGETVKLDTVADKITVGFVGEASNEYADEGVPYLRTQNVRVNRIDLNGLIYVNEAFHNKNQKSIIHPGDVVISRVGVNRGMAAMIPDSLPEANIANCLIVGQTDNINSYYLAFYMNMSFGKRPQFGASVGSAQGVINTSILKKWEVYVPDKKLQDDFFEFSSQIDKSKVAVQKALDETQLLFDSLMQQYFG